IRTVSGLGLISLLNAVFALLLILPMMAAVSWRLTLPTFLPAPLLAVIAYFYSKRIHQQSKTVQESLGVVSSSAQQPLTGVRVIRAYSQEQSEIENFRGVSKQYLKNNLTLIRNTISFRAILQFFIGSGFVMLLLYGGRLSLEGKITVGQLVQQTLYLGF